MIKAVETQKCKSGSVYFAENYVKPSSDVLVNFKLTTQQKEVLKEIYQNKKVAFLAPRQSGKSLCGIVSILYFVLFNENKTVVLHSPRFSSSRDLLKQIAEMHSLLPDWITLNNQLSNKQSHLEFGNGCKIYIYSESLENQFRGTSRKIDFFYADEAAYIKNLHEVIENLEFYIFPDTRILFTTSANEHAEDFIKDIYKKAEHGLNDFGFVRSKWSDVLNRDWAWKKDVEALIGEKEFKQEYECQW